MTQSERIKLGIRRNTLNRYNEVLTYYKAIKQKHRYINITQLYKEFIYPKFYISKTTFYNILATPVTKELKQIEKLTNIK